MSKAISELALEDIQAEIRRLAAEKPDYVYQSPHGPNGACMYTEIDSDTDKRVGSCIVGQALINLGVSAEAMKTHEGESALSVISGNGELMWYEAPPVMRWISNVQHGQDNGRAWAAAVERADEKVSVPVQ